MSRKGSLPSIHDLPVAAAASASSAAEEDNELDLGHVEVTMEGPIKSRAASPAPEPPSVVACIFAWPMRALGLAETEP